MSSSVQPCSPNANSAIEYELSRGCLCVKRIDTPNSAAVATTSLTLTMILGQRTWYYVSRYLTLPSTIVAIALSMPALRSCAVSVSAMLVVRLAKSVRFMCSARLRGSFTICCLVAEAVSRHQTADLVRWTRSAVREMH